MLLSATQGERILGIGANGTGRLLPKSIMLPGFLTDCVREQTGRQTPEVLLAMRVAVIGVVLGAASMTAWAGEPPASLQAWWVDSLQKVLVSDKTPAASSPGVLRAARGENEAIQLAVRSPAARRVTLKVEPFGPELRMRIRTVGRVRLEYGTPGSPLEERVAAPPVELPEPLFLGSTLDLRADRTECYWLDVDVPATAKPGLYRSVVEVASGEVALELPLELRVYSAVVPFEGRFLLTNWFSVRPKELGFGEAPPGSEQWWACARVLFDSMWAHRQNMFWTPLGPPFIRPVVTEGEELGFDFALFDAWVEEFSRPRGGARKTYIEGQPIAARRPNASGRSGYHGVPKARIWRIENGTPREAILDVTDPAAREGYRVFLTALRDHLVKKGWIDRFRIHIFDEPHAHQLEPYAVVAGYVREFAPQLTIMEALDVKKGFEIFEKLCDVWVPQLGRFDGSLDLIRQRMEGGKEVWLYTCGSPQGAYPNRLMDYPLIKTRLLPWINFRWGFAGYLHWAFNNWDGDPFQNTAGGTLLSNGRAKGPGDRWIVYPGDRCVVDSVRHEAMRDGIEDYELLTVLAARDREQAERIAKTVVSTFTDYVRDVTKFRQARLELLEALEQ